MYKETEWFLKMKENVAQQMGKVNTAFDNGYKKALALQKQFEQNANKTKQFGESVDSLNTKLDNLTKKRNISVDHSAIKNLHREIDQVERQIERIKGTKHGGGMFSGVRMRETLTQIPGIGGAMSLAANPYVIGAMLTLGAGKFAYGAGMTNLSFDQQFAKINATAQLKAPQLAALRGEIMNAGRNSTTDINTVPAAYEKILSATNNVRLSTDILKTSLLGAQAGFADVNEVAMATTGIMNSVGSKQHSAKEVMDVLFASKRLGVGEFKDFAQYLGAPIAQGNAIGYDYRATAGAFSYLTTKGRSADMSQTLMTNLFTALSKKEVLDDLKKYGVKVFDKSGTRNDLFSVVTQLEEKLQGTSQEKRTAIMSDIIKDNQGRDAMNMLLSDTKNLGLIMRQTAGSAGELKAALDSTGNGLNDKQKLSNNWEAFKDNLGKEVAPALIDLFQSLNGVLDTQNRLHELNQMTPEDRKKFLTTQMLDSMRKGQGYGTGNITELGIAMEQLGQFPAVQSHLNAIKNWSNISTDQIRKDPALWGLKYKGERGTIRDFYKDQTFSSDFGNVPSVGKDNSLNTTMDNISGGGSIKNFTVNIGKFQDKTEIHSKNLTEGLNEVEDKQFAMFMRIVQGVEMAAGAN